jgi:hypothetical protein
MSATVDENLAFLRTQLEGLELIFFELIPFGVALKRQDIQEFYDVRFTWASKPNFSANKTELRRQFNSKANQVRNIVDGAETLGNAQHRFSLIYSGSSLPAERDAVFSDSVQSLCQSLLEEGSFNFEEFIRLLSAQHLSPVEARVLLASSMFMLAEEVNVNGQAKPLYQLIELLLERLGPYLDGRDPFQAEARVLIGTMKP